jgi:hypothetical protein
MCAQNKNIQFGDKFSNEPEKCFSIKKKQNSVLTLKANKFFMV